MFGPKSILAATAVAASCANALAADYPMPQMQQAPVMVQEFTSGWYLRGDVGYRLNDFNEATAESGPAITGSSLQDNSYVFGGGFGYKNAWFRADFTADWATRLEFNGNTATIPSAYQTKIDAVTLLFNMYVDLGTWSGFTPYVGGGIGASWLKTADTEFRYLPNTDYLPEKETWNLAWAATGGIAYYLTPMLLLDINYRYLHLGNAKTYQDDLDNFITVKGMNAHEIRVGLRYNLY
ncbi:MAG: porin family protein [Pseudorhodoplanes sp.]|nr:porin family protein [Pseudorhodoplanes sp.]